jgi:DNA-directed RNA polymerase subunit RPC12/RpoP
VNDPETLTEFEMETVEIPERSTSEPVASLAEALASVPDFEPPSGYSTGADTTSCPGCGKPWFGPLPDRASANAFCPACDYPMFLKPRAVVVDKDPAREPAKRRSPGVNGRDLVGQMACPRCGESNRPDDDGFCVRCGDALVPPPPPEPVPEPEPQIVHVYVDKAFRKWRLAALVLAGALVIALTAIIVIVNNHH